MIALAIITLVMGPILGSVIFFAKSGTSVSNHVDMNAQTRLSMDYLSKDAIATVSVLTAQDNLLIVVVEAPDETTHVVTYRVEGTSGTFTRQVGTSPKMTLVSGVTEGRFFFFDSRHAETSNIIDIKNISLELKTARSVASQTQNHSRISARYVLRNRATSSG
jgi:hypothetical protein